LCQCLDEVPQRTERQRIRALGIAGRQAALERRIGLRRQRVTEEQTLQAVGETVPRLRRGV